MSTLNKIDTVKNDIKLRIFKKEILPGQFVSERGIAREYNISRGTARKALIELHNQEIFSIVPSKGYKVNPRRTDPILIENGFDKKIEKVLGKAQSTKISIISKNEDISINKEIRDIFDCENNATFLVFSARRTTQKGNIVSYISYYFPSSIISSFNSKESCDLSSTLASLLPKVHKMLATVKFVKASSTVAETLNLKTSNQTVVKRDCRFIGKNGDIVYYSSEYTVPEQSVNILPSNEIFRKVNGFLE